MGYEETQAPQEKLVEHVATWARGLTDGEEMVRDMLTDLRHFAWIHAVDWDAAISMSARHFEAERKETQA